MDETRKALENFEVTELDDRDLEGVSGGEAGCTNGNCSCPPGSSDPNGCTNANCSGGGGSELA